MHSHDYGMVPRRELSDLINEAGQHSSFDGWDARITDAYSFWPSYQPYQPEIPAPARYERLAPPPPAFAPEPNPELVRYEDGLMTQAMFDWNMRNLPQPSAGPLDDWI